MADWRGTRSNAHNVATSYNQARTSSWQSRGVSDRKADQEPVAAVLPLMLARSSTLLIPATGQLSTPTVEPPVRERSHDRTLHFTPSSVPTGNWTSCPSLLEEGMHLFLEDTMKARELDETKTPDDSHHLAGWPDGVWGEQNNDLYSGHVCFWELWVLESGSESRLQLCRVEWSRGAVNDECMGGWSGWQRTPD
jgi:hypothetical protein